MVYHVFVLQIFVVYKLVFCSLNEGGATKKKKKKKPEVLKD